MIAYKVKETSNFYEKGRILCDFGTLTILLANCSQPQAFVFNGTISNLKSKGLVEEIDLKDEKWIHPHLYGPLKKELLKEI